MSRFKYAGVIALLAVAGAHAEGPRIGFEYESEKDKKSGVMNDAVKLKPGWEFSPGSFINLVELLIDHNRDRRPDFEGFRARENKLFIRLRHGRAIGHTVSYYIRGGVGRSMNNHQDFSYGYVEAGLKLEMTRRWDWTAALREGNSIDGTDGERFGNFITGPSFSLDKFNEVELRYVRGFRDKDTRAWEIGYTRRF